MLDRSTLKWFTRGFVLTLLILLTAIAVLWPNTGLAQEGQGNLPQGRSAKTEASTAAKTDDPSGRSLIPWADTKPPVSNLPAAGLSLPASAQWSAVEGAIIEANSPNSQPSPLLIPAADFRDDGFRPSSHYFSFDFGFQQGGVDPGYGCIMAPAYLPHGAQLTELFASVYDNDNVTGHDIRIELRRVSNFDGSVDLMAQASTAGAQEGIVIISDLEIDHPLVLYPDYSYYVTTCLQSTDLRLYSVRLYFNAP